MMIAEHTSIWYVLPVASRACSKEIYLCAAEKIQTPDQVATIDSVLEGIR
jgi:hypothetical protein